MTAIAHPRNARIFAIASLLVGLSLSVTVAPLLVSEVMKVPGRATLKKIQRRQPVDDQELATLVDSREQSLAWRERGRTWTDLGLALMVQAAREKGDARRARYERAREALIKGLAMAPANPYGWFRLARLHLRLDGATQAAADAVSLGMATGPWEHGLFWSKFETALVVWDLLDAGDRATIERLVPEALRRDRKRLVGLAVKTRRLRLLLGVER